MKNGRRAKLIQSLDGVRLYNLVELRAFVNEIAKELPSPVISDEIWKGAKEKILGSYHNSACIENVKRLLSDFEATHSVKYRSDFEEFINESGFEDFYDEREQETVYVSTIHKSKGREFDNVYIMLKNFACKTDAERRVLYVGMTRAKSNLYIHTNTSLLDDYQLHGVDHIVDQTEYGEASEIMLQTTYRDVVLDFFKGKKSIIYSLRSGAALKIDDVYLMAEQNRRCVRVARFSKAFIKKLEELRKKGYIPQSAEIRFIVLWKGEDDVEETPVILADVYLKKVSQTDTDSQTAPVV